MSGPQVRAKFRVTGIKRKEGSRGVEGEDGRIREVRCELYSVELTAVSGNGDPDSENTWFWQYSPGGRIEIDLVDPVAVTQFAMSREYYVDFTLA